MHWTKEQRAFACKAYFSNGRSIVSTQHAFRTRFSIHPAGPVPGRQSIVSWVHTFRVSGSVTKTGSGGHQTARIPENWTLLFRRKRTHCYGECSSLQGHDWGFFSPKPGRNGPWWCVVPTGWSHGTHSARINGTFEGALPRAPHLLERRPSVAGALARFDSMRLFLMGLPQIHRLCWLSTDPSSPEGQHTPSHRQHTRRYARKSCTKLWKSGSSVYWQWRPPLGRCNF